MIRVANISKRFKLYASPADRLKELLLRKKFHVDYDALDNLSFEVKDGETLGVIGRNGAGKSTLLKILTGVTLPDSGVIDINGKITGLLELGTGFNPELTGMQNIHDNGLLLNMTSREIEEKRDAIIEFSELGDFINEPIKTYSSGMVMRLAFSIAIHAEPKCFVVDEALSVGDAHFQQKCTKRIKEFRDQGGSIIFVSHDMNAVKTLCDSALLLERGQVISSGDPESVVNNYNFLLAKSDGEAPIKRQATSNDYGTMEAQIERVQVTGEKSLSSVVSSGETVLIEVTLRAVKDIDNVTIGMLIRDKFGQDIFGTNSRLLGQSLTVRKGQRYTGSFEMPIDLGAGKYTITIALHTEEDHVERCFHWHDRIASLEVAGYHGSRFTGLCRLHPSFSFHAASEAATATAQQLP
jgi:lipopolysaccharide transport system ATP-binding protein